MIRTFTVSLLLITLPLIVINFRLGGRYLILLDAFSTAYLAQLIRNMIKERLSAWYRALLSGFSIVAVLFLNIILFPRLNLSVMGILFLYMGMVCMETILPNEITYRIWQNQ